MYFTRGFFKVLDVVKVELYFPLARFKIPSGFEIGVIGGDI